MFKFFKRNKKNNIVHTEEKSPKTEKKIEKVEWVEDGYIFNLDPEKYSYCKKYLDNLTAYFYIDSKYRVFYHYVALNKAESKLYEIHTRVIGFEGEYKHTKQVEDFVIPPREITIDEFIDISERVYPGSRALYDGINKNNLSLYNNLIKRWKMKNSRSEWDPTAVYNRGFACELELSEENRIKLVEKSKIFPLVDISEFLVSKDFIFKEAYVGGGTTEISHTGTLAYNANYFKLEDFRDNFKKDMEAAQVDAITEYQSWATLDYEYIVVALNNGLREVKVTLKDKIIIEWLNVDNSNEAIIEETKKKMIDILGCNTEIEEYYFI